MTDAEICRAYQRGYSIAQIAELDGRSESTIYARLIESGQRLRSRSEANQKFPTVKAIVLYNLGLSIAQVGEVLGVHPTTILKRLEADGFPLRPQSVASDIAYSEDEFRKLVRSGELTRMVDAILAKRDGAANA